MKKAGVVLCGLGFGGAFVPIYRDHPNVKFLGIYDIDKDEMKRTAEFFGIKRLYNSFEEILNDAEVDAVEERDPAVSLDFACNISAAGILAHASALAGGKEIEIPEF